MPANWTGDLLGRMHNAGVTRKDIAKKVHYSYGYVSMIFNSKRATSGEKRELFEQAFEQILAERNDH